MIPSVDQIFGWGGWSLSTVLLIIWWFNTKNIAEHSMQPRGEISRKSQARSHNNASKWVLRFLKRVVDGSGRHIHNAIMLSARNKPIDKNNWNVGRVNDFGQLNGSSGRQIFGHDFLQKHKPTASSNI